jgi:hypothetical protein
MVRIAGRRFGIGLLIVLAICAVFFVLSAEKIYAAGEDADMQCIGDPSCPCMKGPPGKCNQAGNGILQCPCVDTTNGFPTAGKCVTVKICKGETGAGKGLDSGLGQLGKMLGDLLSKLAGGGGSGSPPPSTPPPTTGTTGCTGAYYQTSDISKIGVDPCAQYSAPLSNNINLTPTTGTGTCDSLSAALGICTNTVGGGGTGTSTGTTLLSPSPTSGSAPLSVAFTGLIAPCDPTTWAYEIDPGDSATNPQYITLNVSADASGNCAFSGNYTYKSNGNYTPALDQTDGSGAKPSVLTSASVKVGGSSSGSNGSSTVSTLPILFASTTVGGIGVPGFINGPSGNIIITQRGATVVSGSVNGQSNTEMAGFYGSETSGAQQPQGLVAQWCATRPWATNFLSSIVPPTFLDGLCSSLGYQVGTPPPPSAPVLEQTVVPAKTTSKVTAPTSTAPVIAPHVSIRAAPASVPLDTRTSIFWNSQGVTDCTETSSDGSFNQSSLSGGAATVPLTSATTFTISCLAPDGSQVTGYVTVNLSI